MASRHVRSLGLLLLVLMAAVCCWAAEFNGFEDINGTLVKCHTTAADGAPFVLEIKEEWAPLGAQRFLDLVKSGYFAGVPFFRVVPGFLTQFGITPDKELRKHWREQGSIPDDPNQHRQIMRGYLSFAGGGANTRDMQLFIALSDSDWLGKAPWEVPVGRVIYGMDDVIDKLYAVGEIHPFDETGVKQGRIWSEGNDYLHREFPKLDYFKDCAIVGPSPEQQQPQKHAAAAAAAAETTADKAAAKAGAAEAARAGEAWSEAGQPKAKAAPPASGKLAAVVEQRIAGPAVGRRPPDSATWGPGTLCLIVGGIGLFAVLLYRLGEGDAGAAKLR